jgi:hypothetical protein
MEERKRTKEGQGRIMKARRKERSTRKDDDGGKEERISKDREERLRKGR